MGSEPIAYGHCRFKSCRPSQSKEVAVKRTLKNVLLVGLAIVVPGMGLAWLIKVARHDADKEDFKRYVKDNYFRMKAEEQQWLH